MTRKTNVAGRAGPFRPRHEERQRASKLLATQTWADTSWIIVRLVANGIDQFLGARS